MKKRHILLPAITAAMLSTGGVSTAWAQNKAAIESITTNETVTAARKYLGTNYNWEGRMTRRYPGLDCLGLMFKALEERFGVPWQKWNTYPTKLIPQLGKNSVVVIMSEGVSLDKLKEGDFIFFLWHDSHQDEPAVVKGEDKYWVWHTAIYAGNGNIIHASPFNGRYKVVEEPLTSFMESNEFLGFIAVTPNVKKRGK